VIGAPQKIGTHTVGQYRRFADIQDLARLILEQIDAGLIRQVREFGFERWSSPRHASFYEASAARGKVAT
jgi:hypothetical protein